jgi:hypothetical protein
MLTKMQGVFRIRQPDNILDSVNRLSFNIGNYTVDDWEVRFSLQKWC